MQKQIKVRIHWASGQKSDVVGRWDTIKQYIAGQDPLAIESYEKIEEIDKYITNPNPYHNEKI